VERRRFLELAGLGLGSCFLCPRLAAASESSTPVTASQAKKISAANPAATYGSGHFGKWIEDSFGLPAYLYTCDQLTDPKAVLPVDKAWRSPTDHIHQVGNDRIVAVVSNYGHIQVRQDEGGPKFLNDYFPERNRYGAGIGFLADNDFILSTHYSGIADSFERIMGMGYLRKRVTAHSYEVDHVIFAPFGDDPVLVSQVTITNHSKSPAAPSWVEYWGCQNYQFSYRSLMEATVAGSASTAPQLRRDFCARFAHQFKAADKRAGLLESQKFLGRTPQEEAAWQKVQATLKADPTGFYGGPVPPLAPRASMEDISPPPTFLVSLDAPADACATNAVKFFNGSVDRPQGISAHLDNDLSSTGPESAFLLERRLALQPGESRTIYFLYGYLPDGFRFDGLLAKYAAAPSSLWSRSSSQWKAHGLQFRTESEPWVERETVWSGYYLRSGLTYDSFFREHILSQGAGFQYLAGLQGAARDPLQHVLPFIFSDPQIVREVIRYTLKEIQPDNSLPYGIAGSGVPMPCIYRPSDLQMWLLWASSEYILATRDKSFLDERISKYPGRKMGAENPKAEDPTVLELLFRSYTYLISNIGVGKHGLIRLLNGDWNDSIVVSHLTPAQVSEVTEQTESVLNAAMASYALAHYARMLNFIGRPAQASDARTMAKAQRQALRQQWTGRWFRRAWLGETLGWVGEKQMWLEPQPWAIIGGGATPEQVQTLLSSFDELVRKPSPIGALVQSKSDPTMKDEPGTGTNGGIFAAINGTLIWALALVNGELAWDEWKKNTLARHAEVYPDMWFGIWSGPDCYNSVLSKNPGSTGPDFPVLNMHSHAWPLYTAAKLLGLEFHERGIHFRPLLTLPEYEFASPLLGFSKTPAGYSGWYAPLVSGTWEIEIELPAAELTRIRRVIVNGVEQEFNPQTQRIRFSGDSKSHEGTSKEPLRWKIT
jgi:hypothetical protein